MIGDHHGQGAGRATLLVSAVDAILGTHRFCASACFAEPLSGRPRRCASRARVGPAGGGLAAAVSYGPWLAFYAVAVGTFTFLFTDIEGSTALLGRVGQDIYAQVLAGHHSIIRSGLAAHGGREVDTQGDAFFAVFSSPAACVAAVIGMQQALAARAWPGGEQVRVRMGVHTG
jgi:class 3 adenylate cyclase